MCTEVKYMEKKIWWGYEKWHDGNSFGFWNCGWDCHLYGRWWWLLLLLRMVSFTLSYSYSVWIGFVSFGFGLCLVWGCKPVWQLLDYCNRIKQLIRIQPQMDTKRSNAALSSHSFHIIPSVLRYIIIYYTRYDTILDIFLE